MLWLLICVCILCLVWTIHKFRENGDGPPVLSRKLPFIGHGHLFLGGSVGMWKCIKSLSEESLAKGGINRIYLGSRTVYALTDPEACLAVSNACLRKDLFYDFAKPFLGGGLIIGSGPTWKRHRKLLTPAFNQQVLNSFISVFNDQARRLTDQFIAEVGKPVNQEYNLRLNNLETICITSLGVGFEYNDVQKHYLPCMGSILNILNERIQKVWLHNDFIYNLTSLKKRQDVVLKNLFQLSGSIVQNKRKEMDSKIMSGDLLETSQSVKLKPFMDLILELNCFTDEEIREETDNIIAGGHDTSASLLTFALLVLGSYPEIQDKVYDEIISIHGKTEMDFDKEDLARLVYTETVLKETLRLYPIGPFVARFVDQDVKWKNYTIKANSGCYMLVYGLHRHPIWGADANEFRPERWLDPTSLPDMSYFGGFGLGRRACIGKVYAMMSMKTVLAHMVRRYRITSDISQLKLKMDVMLRPESGHHITLEMRT